MAYLRILVGTFVSTDNRTFEDVSISHVHFTRLKDFNLNFTLFSFTLSILSFLVYSHFVYAPFMYPLYYNVKVEHIEDDRSLHDRINRCHLAPMIPISKTLIR